MSGIYIHIPFCIKKCSYCDFLSFPASGETMRDYVDALTHEMEQFKQNTDLDVDTIFIGGGTPTVLPEAYLKHVIQMCAALASKNPSSQQASVEFTVEVNPGTVHLPQLQMLYNEGVNRLSFGLQSTHDRLLESISRIHNYETFEINYITAREVGFENINIDLMFGLPNQSMQEWRESLEKIISLAPEHISVYSLILAEDTPLSDHVDSGVVALPDETTDRAMYHLARQMLTDAGYIHYEISNFAKPGYMSRHNTNCWRRVPYYGFGLGAHSFDGNMRWHNTENMNAYIHDSGSAPLDVETLTKEEAMSETIILGLRLLDGVNEHDFYEQFGVKIKDVYLEEITNLLLNGLIIKENGRICLSEKGLDLANVVMEQFL